jgi:AcrR family transcriptional regulator
LARRSRAPDEDESRLAAKGLLEVDDESIPAWLRQSMQRSMQTTRARAHARSSRFVKAATQLLQEKGDTDFTVQDVVERSGMSIRAFYKYFPSKEELMVAVYETLVARDTVPRLRKLIEKHKDPLRRLRAYVEALVDLTSKAKPFERTFTVYQNRLAESRPADLARSMRPQFELVSELIKDVARTWPLRRDLTVEMAARLMQYTVIAVVHGRVLGSEDAFAIPTRTIWEFCATGMGFPVGESPSESRAQNAARRPRVRKASRARRSNV